MNAKFILLIFFTGCYFVSAQNWDSVKVAKIFGKNNGTLIIYDNAQHKYFRYNNKRGNERFLPASTFKIPNSLIGLETGIIKDENYVVPWDGINRPVKEWNQDHTLASAIKYSVVPYYQVLAKNVGPYKYPDFLKQLNYGNQQIGKKIDYFWLDNSLKISAEEQIIFLRNFYDYKIPFSKNNIDLVKKIIPEEKYKNSFLKFKTGTGQKENGAFIGWLVGYVKTKNNVYFYAFNVDGKTYGETKQLRDSIPRKILIDQKFIR